MRKLILVLVAVAVAFPMAAEAARKNKKKRSGAGSTYNDAKDTLCRGGTGSKQTTPQPDGGGISYCDMIYNQLKDPCTGAFVDQLASQDTEDMEDFCPGFGGAKSDKEKVRIMLMNFVASVVTTESHWNPKETGDGGKSKGMLQLTKKTDQRHGCACGQLQDEFNAKQNLACGTQMIVSFMAKDKTVGKGKGDRGSKGAAKSFGPFRDGRKEREAIKGRISKWCSESLNAAPSGGQTGTETAY